MRVETRARCQRVNIDVARVSGVLTADDGLTDFNPHSAAQHGHLYGGKRTSGNENFIADESP